MLKIKQKGDFSILNKYLKKSIKVTEIKNIIPIADECIRKLQEVTPKDSGLTATSWTYEIENKKNKTILKILNTNISDGLNVAFLLDVGHATSAGTWIEGRNYIEPTVRESFNKILNNTWKELKRL